MSFSCVIVLYAYFNVVSCLLYFFFLNNTPPPEIYPLPLHAALPISPPPPSPPPAGPARDRAPPVAAAATDGTLPAPRFRPAAGPRTRRATPPRPAHRPRGDVRSEEHTSELQSRLHLVCRLLLEKKKK